jgi:hypothetical protein
LIANVVIVVHRENKLLHVSDTIVPPRRFARCLYEGQRQKKKYADHRDANEHVTQSETGALVASRLFFVVHLNPIPAKPLSHGRCE